MRTGVASRNFDEKSYEMLADMLSAFIGGLSIKDNFKGKIIDNVIIPASTEIKISHSLKAIPKYKIILRQRGNALITDGDEAWTENYITLKNNTATESTVSVWLIGG